MLLLPLLLPFFWAGLPIIQLIVFIPPNEKIHYAIQLGSLLPKIWSFFTAA